MAKTFCPKEFTVILKHLQPYFVTFFFINVFQIFGTFEKCLI